MRRDEPRQTAMALAFLHDTTSTTVHLSDHLSYKYNSATPIIQVIMSETTTKAEPATSKRITWEKLLFLLQEPSVVSLDDCLRNLDDKLHFVEAMEAATTSEEKAYLQELLRLLREFIRAEYNNANSAFWKWRARNLTGDDPGIYLIVYPSGAFKFGMSTQCRTRVKRQKKDGFRFAAKVMDQQDVENAISPELVAAIHKLECPGLVVHEDKEGEIHQLIARQLCELFFACSRQCDTKTSGNDSSSYRTSACERRSPALPSFPKKRLIFCVTSLTVACRVFSLGQP